MGFLYLSEKMRIWIRKYKIKAILKIFIVSVIFYF